MWVISRAGFFSAVQKGAEGQVCLRGRVLDDFSSLKRLYYPEMPPVIKGEGTDYPYRIYLSHQEWARIAHEMAMDVDYSNFKSMVSRERGYAVADLYHDVWAVMYGAEKKVAPQRPSIPVDFAERRIPASTSERRRTLKEAHDRHGLLFDADEVAFAPMEEVYEEAPISKKAPPPKATAKHMPNKTPIAKVPPLKAFSARFETRQAEVSKARRDKKASSGGSVRGANGRFTR